jgi:hypothetical protein
MPFGALSSALQVRNVSYLWSLAFWASATSPCLQGRRKYSFLLLTLSSILLAATVGPSVAIALIPADQLSGCQCTNPTMVYRG